MILEGIVTSVDGQGRWNVAPMGPLVEEPLTRLVLRPFPTSRTCQNLREHPRGVFHVIDDVLLLARAAIGALPEFPDHFPAEKIQGRVLSATCRWYEFEVETCDDSQFRVSMEARIVHAGRLRDFLGFNRARHAVLEAAILATRTHLLPAAELRQDLVRLRPLVDKTGGPRELEAFALLEDFIHAALREPCADG